MQALPKSDRSELAIELATEAGADAFVAWQASRCVARWESAAKVDKGLRRWRAVARSAARQSRRPYIPSVSGVVSTAELAQRVRDDGATTLVLHESATVKLTELSVAQPDSLLLIVGPEGGIADDEICGAVRCRGDSGAAWPDGAADVDSRGRRTGRIGCAHPAVAVMGRQGVKHWEASVPGGKLGVQEQTTRPEPRKQAENPR